MVDLLDVTFLISVRIDTEDRLDNIWAIVRFIKANYNTNIIILEADLSPKIAQIDLPAGVEYVFIKNKEQRFHRTKYNNILIGMAQTDIIAIYDSDIIIPPKQFLEAMMSIRKNRCDLMLPYDGTCLHIDPLMKRLFIKNMSTDFFEQNLGKIPVYAKRAPGGCILIRKQVYIDAGRDNEFINSWGPEDIERLRRLKILGYRVRRLKGNLYHLHHRRSSSSGYQSTEERINLMNEYIKVSSMSREELNLYIKSWRWDNCFPSNVNNAKEDK